MLGTGQTYDKVLVPAPKSLVVITPLFASPQPPLTDIISWIHYCPESSIDV